MSTSSDPSKLCLVGPEVINDQALKALLADLTLEVIECPSASCTSEDGSVTVGDIRCDNRTLFVLRDFEGDDFVLLSDENKHIIGSTALRQHLTKKLPLFLPKRPLHNLAMKDLLVTFTQSADMVDAKNYLNKLRFMGATSRENMSNKITHLIATKPKGGKYMKAVNFGVTIMRNDWIAFAWDQRFNPDFDATEVTVIERFDLKPFTSLYFGFVNFKEAEVKEMQHLTITNGGMVVSPTDEKCTHIIAGYQNSNFKFSEVQDLKMKYVVTTEWFWASVEMNGKAEEDNYAFPVEGCRTGLKHGSSRMSMDILSPCGLDFSTSYIESPNTPAIEMKHFDFNKKTTTKRQMICHELFTTDRNYLNVLKTIVTVFQKPLEQNETNNHLDATEIKIIFGNLSPIVEVHEKICEQLANLIGYNWKENCKIGQIILDNAEAMLKAYPPFVNFFEKTREMIEECDTKYPRFHAFIKKCESKPECNRETLTQMMIRPVQRLPSVKLLLADILKATEKSNPDYENLSKAIESIATILTTVNEGKRKTEGQLALFDLIHDIKDCPASLLSAQRKLITQVDAKILQQDDGGVFPLRNQTLTLFLFTDVLEICKKKAVVKRSDSVNSKGSGKGMNGNSTRTGGKPSYRHIELMELLHIHSVYQFEDTDDLGNAILIESTQPTELNRGFRMYPLLIETTEAKREDFVHKLANCLAQKENVIEKANVQMLQSIDYSHADVLAESLHAKSTIGMARKKLSRAFSMSKRNSVSTAMLQTFTPPTSTAIPKGPNTTPRKLSTRFSQIMHPLRTSFASPLSRREISVSSLSINVAGLSSVTEDCDHGNDKNFSLPSTPAPRKKICTTADITSDA